MIGVIFQIQGTADMESGAQEIFGGKMILLLGPRQVGKTTLARQFSAAFPEQNIWLSGDDPGTVQVFQQASFSRLKAIIGNKIFVVIDEDQRIPGIGITLKII